MKKFLLFLSCFLTTWCSVQAANPTGKITSATYNASNSTFNVSYTSSGANSVSLQMISQVTGIVGSRVSLSTGSASKTIDLPITSRAGEYDLLLYVNGSICHNKKVTVTKYGDITNVTNISTSSVTVKYTMLHAETDKDPSKSYLKIVTDKGTVTHNIPNAKNGSYKFTSLKLTAGNTYTCEMYVDGKLFDSFQFKVPKPTKYGDVISVTNVSTSSVTVNYTMRNAGTSNSYLKIGSYKHNITNVENGIYNWTGLNLTPGATYTCEIYVDGVYKDSYEFKVPSYIDAVTSLTPNGSSLKIGFTLSQTGVNVAFRVTVARLTGGPGETNTINYGICDQNVGTYEVSVPYYTGQVVYAVELLKNGASVNGNSIVVYNR